ncbi:hypothetical protein [Streptomyces sp. NBC_00878]|uniref:DUF6907 domain-containing protein n=1 Tax=Streptomyces sp. NBC_00878 TaxID=2975854 RepID=UPI00225B670A|nr:hypothetical protein [Streptomyces sp. NBC_00878]MCX4908044.1 hypothetical protein [Streptomyces sp. NBC_00878]
MSAPRTATVRTTDHGDVTVTCPAWCLGAHDQDGYRADIAHDGPEHPFTYRGETVGSVLITQAPYAETTTRLAHGHVDLVIGGTSLDPAGLDELAAALVDYAVAVRRAARELAVILAGGGQ